MSGPWIDSGGKLLTSTSPTDGDGGEPGGGVRRRRRRAGEGSPRRRAAGWEDKQNLPNPTLLFQDESVGKRHTVCLNRWVRPSIHLSFHPSILQSIHLSIHPSIHPSILPSGAAVPCSERRDMRIRASINNRQTLSPSWSADAGRKEQRHQR